MKNFRWFSALLQYLSYQEINAFSNSILHNNILAIRFGLNDPISIRIQYTCVNISNIYQCLEIVALMLVVNYYNNNVQIHPAKKKKNYSIKTRFFLTCFIMSPFLVLSQFSGTSGSNPFCVAKSMKNFRRFSVFFQYFSVILCKKLIHFVK